MKENLTPPIQAGLSPGSGRSLAEWVPRVQEWFPPLADTRLRQGRRLGDARGLGPRTYSRSALSEDQRLRQAAGGCRVSALPGMCTLRANSAREALVKMCTLPLLVGENVPAALVAPHVLSLEPTSGGQSPPPPTSTAAARGRGLQS